MVLYIYNLINIYRWGVGEAGAVDAGLGESRYTSYIMTDPPSHLSDLGSHTASWLAEWPLQFSMKTLQHKMLLLKSALSRAVHINTESNHIYH